MWPPPVYSPLHPGAIARALVGGGSPAEELRARLKEWYGAEEAQVTASGTQALQLALRAALRLQGAGTVVALPAFNCFDLVTAAVGAGAPVAFYDLDPLTLAPDPASLEEATAGAGVLVVANLLGYPLDWDQIRGVAGEHGVVVVEDAAQGMGATWGGRAAGTLGDLSVLSFGRGKGWTGGSGGAVLGRGEWGKRLREDLLPHGGSRWSEAVKAGGIWVLARPGLYGLPARIPALGLGETHYREPEAPRAISPFAARLALETRDRSLAEVQVRRDRAEGLRRVIREVGPGAWLPVPVPGGASGDLRLPLLVRHPSREDRRWGIYASYPTILPDLPAVGGLTRGEGRYPGARRLAAELVTAPVHSRAEAGGEVALLRFLEGASS